MNLFITITDSNGRKISYDVTGYRELTLAMTRDAPPIQIEILDKERNMKGWIERNSEKSFKRAE